MKLRNILQTIYGVLTFIPGIYEWRTRKLGSGGTYSARYCYAVWMRHVVKLHENKLTTKPRVVAELGPGDSIGIGLTALLLGAKEYFAFDVVEFADLEKNIVILDELVELIKNKEPIPDNKEFPRIQPFLSDYNFPKKVYSDEYLDSVLTEEKINRIRNSLRNPKAQDSLITYKAPWYDENIQMSTCVDLIISQATLEHIDNLNETYKVMHTWIKPGGVMSHSIDFKSHGYAPSWDGHWGISNLRWKLLKGRRPYLLNREPYSTHKRHILENDFNLVDVEKIRTEPVLKRSDLGAKSKGMSNDDRSISGAYVQCVAH